MNVTLTGPTGAQITLELPVSRIVWGSAPAKRFGEAELFIPANSTAFSRSYIDDRNGESFVQIRDDVLGAWAGFICKAVTNQAGCRIYAKDLAKWFDGRFVTEGRVFQGITAGQIFRAAVAAAFAGVGVQVLNHGTYLESAPALPRYEFQGQSVAQVAADLQAYTGHEWAINQATMTVSWVPPQGTLVETHYCGEGHLVDTELEADSENRVSEVRAVGPTRAFDRAIDGAGAGSGFWSRQQRISVTTGGESALKAAAEAYLATHDQPATVYRGRLRERAASVVTASAAAGISTIPRFLSGVTAGGTPTLTLTPGPLLWDTLREGTVLQTVLPHAGIGGSCPVLRVLSRTYTEGSPYLDCEFQHLRPIVQSSVALVSAKRAAQQATPVHVLPEQTDPSRILAALMRGGTGVTMPIQGADVNGQIPAAAHREIGVSLGSLGFYGGTPVTRPAAYTQTYSTATRTNPNPVGAAPTGITSSTTGTVLAEPSATYTQSEHQQNYRRLQDQLASVVSDLAEAKKLINALIDDHQSLNLAG